MTAEEIQKAILKTLETGPKTLAKILNELEVSEKRVKVQLGILRAAPKQIEFVRGKYQTV